MTDDLVQRLRKCAEEWFEMCDDIHEPLNEAADRIEQHEAFKQEVSDALWDYFRPYDSPLVFQRFIIPQPKPDPLVGVMKYLDWSDKYADPIRAALDALGFEIREKNDDRH